MKIKPGHKIAAELLWMSVGANYWRHASMPFSVLCAVADAFPKDVNVDLLLEIASTVPPNEGQEPSDYAKMIVELAEYETNRK